MATILLIDPDHQEFLQILLKTEGYTVYVATTVITPHLVKNIDLIVLDAGFRGSRIHECIIIQQNCEGGCIPILVTSVNASLESEAKKAGATAFLEKPFDLNELLSIIQGLI